MPPYPGPIPMPEIRPLDAPARADAAAQQASPRLDELRPRIALRPPIERNLGRTAAPARCLLAQALRSISATRKASSSDWTRLSRGSQTDS